MQRLYRQLTGKLNSPAMWASLPFMSVTAVVECDGRDNRLGTSGSIAQTGTAKPANLIGYAASEQRIGKQFSQLAPYQFNQSVLRPGESRARMAE